MNLVYLCPQFPPNFIKRKQAHDYIMEGFIDGTIFTFDGLTDRGGNIIYEALSQRSMKVV